MVDPTSSKWTDEEIELGIAVLEKVANTQLAGKYLPLAVYEAHLSGKMNFSLEAAITDGDGRYYVSPCPDGDVYEGLWHFLGVTFIITDLEAGDPDFTGAFERFEERELGDTPLLSRRLLGHQVSRDPPRGPYVQFIYVAVTDELPRSAEDTGGRFMTLDEIEQLDLVPSHRWNILPLVRAYHDAD